MHTQNAQEDESALLCGVVTYMIELICYVQHDHAQSGIVCSIIRPDMTFAVDWALIPIQIQIEIQIQILDYPAGNSLVVHNIENSKHKHIARH